MSNLTGQQIAHFQIGRLIATGGMAEVYTAVDINLKRKIVLKALLPIFIHDKELLKRFQREAEAIARLNHPNIVQIYFTGATPDGRPYIAMEYVTGGSLEDWIHDRERRGERFTLSQVLFLGQQIAGALGAAHHAGIVHRDLKPSNILMREDGTPLLTDLGIAALLDDTSLTRTGRIVGTPQYMSPEQGKGKKVDGRSDIYSLGVILYELFAGRRPFDGETSWGIINQHITVPPPSLAEFHPELPQHVVDIVHTCLEKEPDHRYQTASQLQNALQKSVFAPTTPSKKQHKSRKSLSGWWLGGVVAIIVLLGFLTFRSNLLPSEPLTPTSIAAAQDTLVASPEKTQTNVAEMPATSTLLPTQIADTIPPITHTATLVATTTVRAVTNTPPPKPTRTATPVPTATPTRTRSATPTRILPTNTVRPATPTRILPSRTRLPTVTAVALVPTATSAPRCANSWLFSFPYPAQQYPGCPPAGISSAGAQQNFENGFMIWIEQLDIIIYSNWTGTIHGEVRDTFVHDVDPINDPNIVAPQGQYQPEFGFGKVWREVSGVRTLLGWGTDWGRDYSAIRQRTNSNNGNYLEYISMAEGGLITISSSTGTWMINSSQ